ncbi:MAG: 2,3-bisphosphoglycerate-independent phosphoglycerate mutase, partial [Bacteroidetes bacterium]
EGQMGNSEVGHLNLGAGRIVYQELQRINVAVKNGSFETNAALLQAINYAKTHQRKLHLLGLVSDGGVHSHTSHLKAITSLCAKMNFHDVWVHAFTDGRDCDPKSGLGFLTDVQAHLQQTTGQIATISGRYYAMDRDKRWERVKLAYDAMVHGIGTATDNFLASVEQSYAAGITDEFVLPMVNAKLPTAQWCIAPDDAVLCFNFRTDRCREITQVLSQTDMPEFGMHKLPLHYTTITEYDKTFQNVEVMFETDNLNNTLGEVIANHGLQQIRIAETEKYPHVTFFFSGGRENTFEGETRMIIPSPKVATYDLQPQMSAPELTAALLPEIEKGAVDFVCLNFANADMVGHTGVFSACMAAAETVDHCVQQIVTAGLANGYSIFLTADHGNSDFEINPDGSPNTQHSLNPVPLFVISNHWHGKLKAGKLGDIAPSILTLMGLEIPKQMTGEVLLMD